MNAKEYVATLTDDECIKVLEEIQDSKQSWFGDEKLLIEAEIYHRYTSRPATLIRKTRNKE